MPSTDRHGVGPQRARAIDVEVPAGGAVLAGYLTMPSTAFGIVVFAHGSGSSRFSPRNQFVAEVLHEAGFGTLLFDLLTPTEDADRANVFDVELLSGRLVDTTRWLADQPSARHLPIGYFGASTGAAAALWAATETDLPIVAVVSRGGRPDLAGPRLPAVDTPTLLIVGSHDTVVLGLNREAQALMTCESHLAVVPGASHLFEEPGTLREAAELARDWFGDHVTRRAPRSSRESDPAPGWRDPFLEAAREEADGVEVYEDAYADEAVLAERESAEGVEVFEDPDAVVPSSALVEGRPGHETLVGERAGLVPEDDDEARAIPAEETYEE